MLITTTICYNDNNNNNINNNINIDINIDININIKKDDDNKKCTTYF